MEPLTMASPASLAGASFSRDVHPASSELRVSGPPRSSRPPGMSFGHDVLLALIMGVAMAATLLLYR
jgi:hypothetical protein